MQRIPKSMDRAVLNLIEVLEREDRLKLSPHRYRPAESLASYLPHELLPAKAAAGVLHVSVQTLANWRVSGAGPTFIKTGRLISYRFSDIQAFIASKAKGSTSETVGAA